MVNPTLGIKRGQVSYNNPFQQPHIALSFLLQRINNNNSRHQFNPTNPNDVNSQGQNKLPGSGNLNCL